jgi:hypothetical protein
MKNQHILNIGYPKCGTTWCWDSLASQSWFSQPREKENHDLVAGIKTVKEYVYDYEKFDITGNFCTAMFAADRYIIQQLSEIPTISISLILRNPFDLYWSLYNFMREYEHSTFDQSIKNLIDQGWFNQFLIILQRWSDAFSTQRFELFFYDDLVSNQKHFIDNYYSRMNLPAPTNFIQESSNVTRYQNKKQPDIDPKLTLIINQDIKNLQSIIDKDISHWLK